MDRTEWMKAKKSYALERMNTYAAPIYDENWGEISATHRAMLERFLERLPVGARILDAACGTGKYWPAILASGRTVFGIDQSGGMLRRAQAKFPQVPVAKTSLQEFNEAGTFDGVICIDALESLFPEDWPLALRHLQAALKPGGSGYLTVELLPENEIAAAYEAGKALGLPLVYGEWAPEGRYHYYPSSKQVETWLSQAGFQPLEETSGEEYQHWIVKKEK